MQQGGDRRVRAWRRRAGRRRAAAAVARRAPPRVRNTPPPFATHVTAAPAPGWGAPALGASSSRMASQRTGRKPPTPPLARTGALHNHGLASKPPTPPQERRRSERRAQRAWPGRCGGRRSR